MRRIEAKSRFISAVKRHQAALEAAVTSVQTEPAMLRVDPAVEEARLRSLFFLNTSGIPELMDRFTELVDGQVARGRECLTRMPVIEEDKDDVREAVELNWPVSDTSSLLIALWNPEGEEEYFDSNAIIVEAMSQGGIIIHGDEQFGTTFLDYDQWRKKPILIEKALERAYHVPRVISCGKEEGQVFVYGNSGSKD